MPPTRHCRPHVNTRAYNLVCSLGLFVSVLTGCANVLELDKYSVEQAPGMQMPAALVECTKHRDCAGSAEDPVVCVAATHRCVHLQSADCHTVTGEVSSDAAVVIASLFAFGGSQAGVSTARQNSAQLAVQELNGVGGIPQRDNALPPRPLVLLSCDASADLVRAGRHLVDELHVPAIIGPNGSQDTIDLSREVSVPGGTLVITPTALASSIADLLDNGLTWQMVPTDLQRGEFMTIEIEALADELARQRDVATTKFAAVFQNDALGIGTRTSLEGLKLNGAPLATLVSRGEARVDAYDPGKTDLQPVVRALAEFAPDIIVLAGTADLVVNVMGPLERAWRADRPRPHYMLIDAMKTPELLDAARADDSLRKRVRGTGVTPSPSAQPVHESFRLSYELAYPGASTDVAGIGQTYDAVYAVAFAMATRSENPVSGRNVADGLRLLSDGPYEVKVQASSALAAFARLTQRMPISAIGTFGPLAWGPNGAVLGGTIELWCIENRSGRVAYQSSGLTVELSTGTLEGSYRQCD